MKIVGVDLAGVQTKQSGFCILDEKLDAKTFLVFLDKEILKAVDRIKPDVVAIDAPLSLPKGRKSLKRKSNIHFRQCDKELWKHGIRFFPITLGPMRKLTERGIKLKEILERKKFEVIEVYPGGAQDILNIPRKQEGLRGLKNGLRGIGIKGLKKSITHDELDAVTCALVGKLYLEKNHTALGDENEGLMIMPKIPKS